MTDVEYVQITFILPSFKLLYIECTFFNGVKVLIQNASLIQRERESMQPKISLQTICNCVLHHTKILHHGVSKVTFEEKNRDV